MEVFDCTEKLPKHYDRDIYWKKYRTGSEIPDIAPFCQSTVDWARGWLHNYSFGEAAMQDGFML